MGYKQQQTQQKYFYDIHWILNKYEPIKLHRMKKKTSQTWTIQTKSNKRKCRDDDKCNKNKEEKKEELKK